MITHVIGDATQPVPRGTSRAILHVCNNVGRWGQGFVTQLSQKLSPLPEKRYRKSNPSLGDIQVVEIIDVPKGVPGLENKNEEVPYSEPFKLFVVNMVAQDGLPSSRDPSPFDPKSLVKCFRAFNDWVYRENGKNRLFQTLTLHMPRIGAGLGGASWSKVEEIIEEELVSFDVYIYTLEREKKNFPAESYQNQRDFLINT